MKITRINKIKGYRVFQSFTWPAELHEFAQSNLFYGWNGSGKTTLSNLFRCIERKEATTEGEIEFQIDATPIVGTTFPTATGLPNVRVFNQTFRDSNVSSFGPILFLGADSIEKQKQILKLRDTAKTVEAEIVAKQSARALADSGLDSFCIQRAKTIKDLLSSSPANPYNSYNKANFRTGCDALIKSKTTPTTLSVEARARFRQQKDNKPKEIIGEIASASIDYELFTQQMAELLERTVVSKVISELASDSTLAAWVQSGLTYHKAPYDDASCRFCGQTLPKERLASIEQHFNDEYNRFLGAVDASISNISSKRTQLQAVELPDKARFYDHLAKDYLDARKAYANFCAESVKYLQALEKALAQKRTQPFQRLDPKSFLSEVAIPKSKDGTENLASLNNCIQRHNTESKNFQATVSSARKALEDADLAENLPEFKKLAASVSKMDEELKALRGQLETLNRQIVALEKEIVEHRRPAEELNEELKSYLGRDELHFEIKESGYQIMRSGQPAENLSEGERTAIAFLYFLKSLQDKAFKLADDIVVVDDPISSLDANALFCAFGYMKERAKTAGQLFILTHNFSFFRQVKNWFNHLPLQGKKDVKLRPARFYMIEAVTNGGVRNSVIKELDPLLHQYESEYHYLFKRVHDEANKIGGASHLEEFYGMPNIARRLLESFLAFRYPSESGELKQQLDLVPFDAAKKSRILRFLHTYSHDGKIAEPEHDLSILAETPDVLKDLLAMLEAEDPKHTAEMRKLITPPTP